MLVELGRLTLLEWGTGTARGRARARWEYEEAPVLAYTPKKRASLVICYGDRFAGLASSRERIEYAKTHWGRTGTGERRAMRVLAGPVRALGPCTRVIYTTQKGLDDELVDYDHVFGDGAAGRWFPPAVYVPPPGTRGAVRGTFKLAGGTYRVTTHGIVG